MNVPEFIIPKKFDARTDSITFDFIKNNKIFEEIKASLKKNKMAPKVARADMMFDIVGFLILCTHIFMSFYGVYYGLLPDFLMVMLFVCTRTSLAGVGHYHCHRKNDGIDDWGDALFDI